MLGLLRACARVHGSAGQCRLAGWLLGDMLAWSVGIRFSPLLWQRVLRLMLVWISCPLPECGEVATLS